MNGIIGTWMLCVAASAPAATRHDDYTEALKAARADRKPLLVVLHNPQQSQQKLAQASHTNGEVGSLLDNYHVCQIDVSTPNGKRVASVFRATTYPYTVITDRTAQKIIFRKSGEFTDAEWIETLADYRRGAKPIAVASFSQSATSFGSVPCAT